jgi:short subunit dehydrogenase-like uncharacterized protein
VAIVVFGATGYTGRLVADALSGRGERPMLAGRNPGALEELAAELGGLDTAVADVARPESVRALVSEGDVLVSTVGPFVKWGAPAVEAAIDGRAHYIDSTGEPAFIRRIFEGWGPRAEVSGCGLVTAFGYDYVPGNLAAALALERAGGRATKVAVGYFTSGDMDPRGAMSGGTAATLATGIVSPHFAFRDGRVVPERSAKRVRSFDFGGKKLSGISVGSSEHFTLPRIHPSLREVDAYLGWFGPASRAMQAMSAIGSLPGVGTAMGAMTGRLVRNVRGGPDAEARAKSGSRIVAETYDPTGATLSRVELTGPNGYTFTGDIIAWGAQQAAEHGLEGTGALGPVDAFGLRRLEAGCAEVGLVEAGKAPA